MSANTLRVILRTGGNLEGGLRSLLQSPAYGISLRCINTTPDSFDMGPGQAAEGSLCNPRPGASIFLSPDPRKPGGFYKWS
jgi:hypothetical protein